MKLASRWQWPWLIFALVAMVAAGSCTLQAQAPATATQPAATQPSTQAAWPQAAIGTGDLKLTIYTPDAQKGYYRGTRFDWSSQLQATYKGHTFFGPREGTAARHDPAVHDHGIGLCEEFGMEGDFSPQGFADAKAGETFMKIGVGLLEKPADDKPYKFNGAYKLVEPGAWTVKAEADSVELKQSLADKRGLAYEYTRRITINEMGNGFVVDRVLKNVGTKEIVTNHYAHNFILIDNVQAGPEYVVAFPFDVPGPIKNQAAKPSGKTVELAEPIKGAVWAALIKEDAPAEQKAARNNAATVTQTRLKAAVSLRGDQPLLKYNLYAEKTAICPEPFVAITVAPGKQFSWQTTYSFELN
jgi:hypothetical protein